MTAKDILLSGGGLLFILMTLVQITPIKVNPWSALGKQALRLFQAIGKAFNSGVLNELVKIKASQQEMQRRLDEHIKIDDERNADEHRLRILRFNNELLRDIPHTQEDFIEVLAEIDFYEDFCDTHPEYKNNRAVLAIAHIKKVYNERLDKHDFL